MKRFIKILCLTTVCGLALVFFLSLKHQPKIASADSHVDFYSQTLVSLGCSEFSAALSVPLPLPGWLSPYPYCDQWVTIPSSGDTAIPFALPRGYGFVVTDIEFLSNGTAQSTTQSAALATDTTTSHYSLTVDALSDQNGTVGASQHLTTGILFTGPPTLWLPGDPVTANIQGFLTPLPRQH